ncbi:MAG: HAMP domain-containing histidine kinase [Cyclobacteriaceae bacterium]|jgi:signal transduction histidine kinase|nr:HAMP domain-containing histidine kinase [Cyclobacteriaceae bacterium]
MRIDIISYFIPKAVFEDEFHKRRVRLGAYLILLYIGVDLLFFVVNLFNAEGEPFSLLVGFLISIICLFLFKWNKVDIAIIIHLLRSNFFAFYFSLIDTDPLYTGSYFYFIPSSLGALAFYGYRERWKGISFTILSYILFLVAIFEPAKFHPSDAHFYLIISFTVILLISLFIIIYFDRMVTNSEKDLMKKNLALIKANQELDRFVYSASHDLRSPLASIAGLIELSKRDPQAQSEYLQLMMNRVNVMDKFIKDIIDYARNARLPASKQILNLYELCNQIIENVKYVDVKIDPKINVLMDKDFLIFSDPARLTVILSNLITNAIKYADPAKALISIDIRATKNAKSFNVAVHDNGIGISEEHQEKIFNMFFRASENATGSGLGLYIVKESLEKLNGSITCQSKPGVGSVFTVTIPMS